MVSVNTGIQYRSVNGFDGVLYMLNRCYILKGFPDVRICYKNWISKTKRGFKSSKEIVVCVALANTLHIHPADFKRRRRNRVEKREEGKDENRRSQRSPNPKKRALLRASLR